MDAIVLSRRDWREHDQIVTIFSKDIGKKELLARGIKKIVSKHAPHCESGSLVDCTIIPGKEIDHLTTVQTITRFSNLYSDEKKLLLARSAISIFEIMAPPHQKDERLFRLLLSYLALLNSQEIASVLLLDAFVLQLLAILGYAPIFDVCSAHGEAHALAGVCGFDGGAVCAETLSLRSESRSAVLCSSNVLSALQTLLLLSWATPVLPRLITEEELVVHKATHVLLQYRSDRTISSWQHIESFT